MEILGIAIPDMVVFLIVYLIFKTIVNNFFNKPAPPVEGNKVVHVLDKEQWDALLKDKTKPLVVDFTAKWCGPCRFISPKYERLSMEYDAVFAKVDVDEVREVSEEAEVRAMPTFMVFVGGKKVDSMTGAVESKLKEMIAKHCKPLPSEVKKDD